MQFGDYCEGKAGEHVREVYETLQNAGCFAKVEVAKTGWAKDVQIGYVQRTASRYGNFP